LIGLLFLPAVSAAASGPEPLALNEDGRTLIAEAAQAYANDMQDRPVVTDPVFGGYVDRIVGRLVPEGGSLPAGVSLRTTVIDSPKPELYAYVDGHLVLTSGLIFAVQNEAQLAGLLSHSVAHVVEGYYIRMYQEIKAAERREARKAAAGALFGALLDVAVDYAVEVDTIDRTDKYLEGEATYAETMKRLAAASAAREAYYSLKDVIGSIPETDEAGQRIDPRLRFEPVADAQGMVFVARAGYEPEEVPAAWRNVTRVNSRLAQEREALMGGAWGQQMRDMQRLMEMNMQRMRQQLGASGLVQTPSGAPPSRAEFVSKLTRLQEVRQAASGRGEKGEKTFREFLQAVLVARAEEALEKEAFERAAGDYQILYDRGIRTAPVAYGLAKSRLGGFAFAASEAEKRGAEQAYREAAALDPNYGAPYRGLGELYEDWERYGEAADAYRQYLKLEPNVPDRSRIQRKIEVLQRKASR
jgi:tetratricopeptide (TPR) repeat protein